MRKWGSICTKSNTKVLIKIKYFYSKYQNQLNEISQSDHNVTLNQCIYVKLYVNFSTFYICLWFCLFCVKSYFMYVCSYLCQIIHLWNRIFPIKNGFFNKNSIKNKKNYDTFITSFKITCIVVIYIVQW